MKSFYICRLLFNCVKLTHEFRGKNSPIFWCNIRLEKKLCALCGDYFFNKKKAMLKQRLINGNGINNTSKTETFNEEQPINKINEWKAAAIALSLSLCVLTIKTFVTNSK